VAAFALIALAGGGATPTPKGIAVPKPDWELVRSVSNPYGGTVDLVLMPDPRKRDMTHYANIANAVCGQRTACMVMFWTDRKHVPQTIDMPVPDLQVMTATYERNPSYSAPVLRLACWLYPSKEVAEKAKCFYMPGGVMPWEK